MVFNSTQEVISKRSFKMKMYLILLFIGLSIGNLTKVKSEIIVKKVCNDINVNLANAAAQIINLQFVKEQSIVNIIKVNELNSTTSQDYISKILLLIIGTNNISYRLEDSRHIHNLEARRRFANVFLIDSFASFKILVHSLTELQFNFSGYFLFVIRKLKISEVRVIFQALWRIHIGRANILLENGDHISMITMIPFSRKACNDVSPVVINKFINGSFLNGIFFPKKFTNLFNCTVKIAAAETEPTVMKNPHDGSLGGSDIELIFELAKMMNFHDEIHFFPSPGSWGSVYENGTVTGAMGQVVEGAADMTIGNLFMTTIRMQVMSNTRAYQFMPLVLIIPPGKPYTSFEKLFMPFQSTVWKLLMFVSACGIGVICVFKFYGPNSQDFVFGHGVRYHYLNMLLIFVGGSQHHLPQGNFARYLLMTFILFCLVQRTLYQGSLYHFFKSEHRAAEVETIDEMIAREFDFIMLPTYLNFLYQTKIYKRRIMVDEITKSDYYENKIFDPSFKGAIATTLSFVLFENQMNYPNKTYKVCKEKLMTIPITLYLRKNHYLIDVVNEKIDALITAGLINYWAEQNIGNTFNIPKRKDKTPKKLNFLHLIGGFQIWCIGCVLGIGTFVGELVWKYLVIQN